MSWVAGGIAALLVYVGLLLLGLEWYEAVCFSAPVGILLGLLADIADALEDLR